MKTSVIIPTYNSSKTIRRCLDSVFQQYVLPDEIIIVDGESSDETKNLVKSYLRKSDRWVSEKDNGPYDAMNKGVLLATGNIICILNSDDLWLPYTLQTVCHHFIKNPDTGIIHGDIIYINNDIGSVIKPTQGVLGWLGLGLPTAHPGAFIRKSVYESVGGYDFKTFPICADQDFVYRAKKMGHSLKYFKTPLALMYAGGMSGTHSVSDEISKLFDTFPLFQKKLAMLTWFLLAKKISYYISGFDKKWYLDLGLSICTFGVYLRAR